MARFVFLFGVFRWNLRGLKLLPPFARLPRSNPWQPHAESVERPRPRLFTTDFFTLLPGNSAIGCASAPDASVIACSISMNIPTRPSYAIPRESPSPSLSPLCQSPKAGNLEAARAAEAWIIRGPGATGMSVSIAAARWLGAGSAKSGFLLHPFDVENSISPRVPGRWQAFGFLFSFWGRKDQAVAKDLQNMVHHRP